ncbi:MAG: phage tail sheath subtilisin-like domain-containing protein [Bacteroidia bacterium]|nr:phage tail sheath subtilisin-like domain-containing protein [Bacteroidia bacterium]
MAVPLSSYKTPGVYVQEIQKLPPSVAQVDTAIPVFIGYTQKAELESFKDLEMVPRRIRSLLEYEQYFGTTRDEDLSISINTISATGNRIIKVENESDVKYHMYYAAQMFFNNGGGEAFVISVGDMTDPIELSKLEAAIPLLMEYTEPTLLLFPDAVEGLTDGDYRSLMQAALGHCANPKVNNCFTVMDVKQNSDQTADEDAEDFRALAGTIDDFKYGAAYYPYIETSLNYAFSLDSVKVSEDLIDGETPEQIVNRLSAINSDDLTPAEKNRLEAAKNEANNRDQFEKESGEKEEAVVELEKELKALQDKKERITDLTTVLEKSVKSRKKPPKLKEDAIKEVKGSDLEAVIEALNPEEGESSNAFKNRLIQAANDTYKDGDNELDDLIAATEKSIRESKKELADLYKTEENDFTNGPFTGATMDIISGVNNGLFNEIQTILNQKGKVIMPPSSAIAGMYARVDSLRGVFKAPANVGLNSVTGPNRKISDDVQEGFNVDSTSGKSINVIRTFKGIGTLVWGARTLAGNDREWRYVSVRRFFNMVEESVKRSLFRFVFEPNNPNTWVSVRASIESFLETQWRAGALLGNTPDDAYFVRVGVPETFTEAEMLDGYMVVEIGMAVVRPAEFIVLKFMHKFELGQQ